jgi:hypothetical protein
VKLMSVIRLDERVAECHICGAESPPKWGIPIYEGDVLPNDWQGEWGGVDACQRCWLHQGRLTVPMPIWQFRKAIDVSHKESII